MARIIPEIPIMFKNKFPVGFSNRLELEGFPKEKLKETLLDGTAKLLMLDIDFGTQCSLNCPHCFRKSVSLNNLKSGNLTYDETISLLKEAKSLGLEAIRILGAGEPFENKDFLGFITELKKLNIRAGIFTKGHVIGDDDLVKKYNAHYGITTGKQLVEKLYALGATIIIGFNSFDTEVQDYMVGAGNLVKNYSQKRNKALKLLIDAGFNSADPTRIALYVAPITPQNIEDVFEIYKWGRMRNLYVISTATMVSGKGKEQKDRQEKEYGKKKFEDALIKLYTRINIWNIEQGIISADALNEQGVSSYAGCFPCNQASCGMYVTLKGKIVRCPGRDDADSTFCEDIRKSDLKKVWMSSENYKRAGTFNNHCPAKDGYTIPLRLYSEVLKNVNKHFKHKN
jgi:MoaA/NifB/PqqE/SkfB family radical SAM enzyme